MLILGIETSCDDTSAAVVEEGTIVRSSVVSSQDEIHGLYGGIVPELASRRHIEMIAPVVDAALDRAGVTLDDISGIGVTVGPGLVGSLLIGLSFAKAAAYARQIPFIGVNHIMAHPLAAFLTTGSEEIDDGPEFPLLSLVVSGGHTSLILYEGFNIAKVVGSTRDDAAGEAFDKVAKLLGLGYPGGAVIDRLAKEGDRLAVPFKRTYLERGSLEFSFSGIKTAVLQHVKKLEREPAEEEIKDIAASFQESVVDVLVRKVKWGAEETGVKTVVAAGGVACNSRLRERLAEMAEEEGFKLFIPPPAFCSDNAAMVALSAFHLIREGGMPLSLNADPNLQI